MLILKRRINEAIIIDNQSEVKVVGIIGDLVRLGITAPREISVHRKEIQDAINKEKELSAAGLVS